MESGFSIEFHGQRDVILDNLIDNDVDKIDLKDAKISKLDIYETAFVIYDEEAEINTFISI